MYIMFYVQFNLDKNKTVFFYIYIIIFYDNL